ncbi:hypothetical protein XELAEV_18040129mg [Xenopus laevis]|uniref:Uncharacterized protein n=1 Tax=Xenopus laevis TaxID=8355 RepID=A0A974C8Z4_XENLA|nr:hypothetical protein XELAEV_18040129mg [Xenopus laevis]
MHIPTNTLWISPELDPESPLTVKGAKHISPSFSRGHIIAISSQENPDLIISHKGVVHVDYNRSPVPGLVHNKSQVF